MYQPGDGEETYVLGTISFLPTKAQAKPYVVSI